jgi:hypothetical protein
LAASKEATVAAASWLKFVYLSQFSRPRAGRQLFRLIKSRHVRRIVEVGISDIDRTVKLVSVAQRFAGGHPTIYSGLDPFDARPVDFPTLTLKQAHRQMQATGAQVRLVPGDPGRSLATIANAHQHTGLLVISAGVSDASLARAWFYVPRMLDATSVVLRESVDERGERAFAAISAAQIAELAGGNADRRAA